MTISTSLARQIDALNAVNESVQSALLTLNEANAALDPESLKSAAQTIQEHINCRTLNELDGDCVIGKALTQCVEKMADGLPGSFSMDVSHFKNDCAGNNHYKVDFTLTPDDNTTILITVPVFIDREETEAELSERGAVSTPAGFDDMDSETLNVLIETAGSNIIYGHWMPFTVDQKALSEAADKLDQASPVLNFVSPD